MRIAVVPMGAGVRLRFARWADIAAERSGRRALTLWGRATRTRAARRVLRFDGPNSRSAPSPKRWC
jgi:hypothetical protein